MNDETIRILLVDDHAMPRRGMVLLLGEESDITVVGESGDSDLHQFLLYFITAVQHVCANACEQTLRMADAPQLPSIALHCHSGSESQ